MRALVFVSLVLFVNGCSCLGCGKKEPPAPKMIPLPEVKKAEAPVMAEDDAGAVEANADAPPDDAPKVPNGLEGNDKLPYEVREGSPPAEKVLEAYLADCHADIEVTFDDMVDRQTKVDCDALAFDQNCSPDHFGCWDAEQKCQAECADPCKTCQTKCGDVCDTCKTKCTGDECKTVCAQERADCRLECLYKVQTCRSDTCNAKYQACEDEGNAMKQRLCPECSAISECLMKTGGEGERGACLPEGNAKECLEWCWVD